MQKFKIAYFGTPDFAAQVLENILRDRDIPVEIKFVVTQEDKKAGRKQVMTPSAVKTVAQRHSIPVLHLDDLTDKQLSDLDLVLLYAFGEIIPKKLLDRPKHGFWNIHPSLLPKYRGPSPVAFALIGGESETGATLMKMDEKLDEGPIIAWEKLKIMSKEKRPELTTRLSNLGYELFRKVITQLVSPGKELLKTQEQNHAKATYSKLLTKKDGFVEFESLKQKIKDSPEELFNLFRGLYPWPGIWTTIKLNVKRETLNVEKRLKITDMDLVDRKLVIRKVQLEGKQEVDFNTFNTAYSVL